MGGLTSLDRVYLGMNEISGTIPSAYGRNWQEVSWMELFGNKLSGTIPPQVGQMESLGALHLHGNPISGSIPEQLGQLSHLITSNLGHTMLSGSLPLAVARLPALLGIGHEEVPGLTGIKAAFDEANPRKDVCDICGAAEWLGRLAHFVPILRVPPLKVRTPRGSRSGDHVGGTDEDRAGAGGASRPKADVMADAEMRGASVPLTPCVLCALHMARRAPRGRGWARVLWRWLRHVWVVLRWCLRSLSTAV